MLCKYLHNKGHVEKKNLDAQRHAFEGEFQGKILKAKNLDELNVKLLAEVLKLNAKERNHGQLSPLAVYNRYEKDTLRALPLIKPKVHYVSHAHVKLDGYVTYQHNFYYAGASNIGKDILIENDMGKYVYLRLDNNKLETIVDYELDKNSIPPGNHHKAKKFQTESEKISARPKDWFVAEFSKANGRHEHVIDFINWVFDSLSSAGQVATRICNVLYAIYTKDAQIDCLNIVCADLKLRGNKVDLIGQIHTGYEMYSKLKEISPELFENILNSKLQSIEGSLTPTATNEEPQQTDNTSDPDSVRGEDYYDDKF